MTTKLKPLPERLHAAYEWTRAAWEVNFLRGLTGDSLTEYTDESEANAIAHGETDVHAADIVALAYWLREGGR